MSRKEDLAGVRETGIIIFLLCVGFGCIVWAIQLAETSPTGDLTIFSGSLALLGLASVGASIWMMFRG